MFTYLPQLDGLRAIAVYLVLFYHAWSSGPINDRYGFADGGFIGVDLFFVLSGFLVSNVILSEIDARGRFDLGGFYARRVRRLLPAAVLVVVATMLAFVLVGNLVRRLEMVGDARSALLYFANWHFLGQENDYFSQDLEPSPFLHFWSLAIEEQFYVFFPLLIALLLRNRAKLTSRLTVVLSLLLLGSVLAQLFWSARGDVNHAYYGSDARLYQLLAGVLLALALRAGTQLFEGRRGHVLLLVGLGGLLLFGSSLLDVSTTNRGFAATVFSVLTIGGLTIQGRAWPSRVLSTGIPVYLGKISYGTYLWHWPVVLILREVLTVQSATIAVLTFVLSSSLAALSYQVFEMPIRTQQFLKPLRWSTVAAGLTVSALVAAFVVSPVLSLERRPALASFDVAPPKNKVAGDGPVPQGIDFKAKLTETGQSKNCSADDLDSCMVVRDNGPLVLLVGDSYANMLGPMFVELAKERGFSLAQNVVRGCPWPADLADTSQAPDDIATCAESRGDWYSTALPALKPDLVILMMRPRDGFTGKISSRSGLIPAKPMDRLIYTTMSDTVREIRDTGTEVLMLQSVVRANPALPLDCLSQAVRLSQCAVTYPVTTPPSDGYQLALAAEIPGVWTTSLNPVICPQPPTCLPYLDGEVVFRDKNHITTSFAVAKRNRVWALIKRSGALTSLSR